MIVFMENKVSRMAFARWSEDDQSAMKHLNEIPSGYTGCGWDSAV